MKTIRMGLVTWLCLVGAAPAVLGDDAPPGCKKVCVCVPEAKQVTHTCYTCKAEDFCAPHLLPPWLQARLGLDKRLGWEGCGRPLTRRGLVKHTRTEECLVGKCVVEHVVGPCCLQAGNPLPAAAEDQLPFAVPPYSFSTKGSYGVPLDPSGPWLLHTPAPATTATPPGR